MGKREIKRLSNEDIDELEKLWPRIPWYVKIKIVITIFAYSWQFNLAYWWLKVLGIDAGVWRNNV